MRQEETGSHLPVEVLRVLVAKKRRLSRRKFLCLAGMATVAGVAGPVAYACEIEPHWIHTVRLDLPIAGLPPALQGRTLVQISDLHIGPVVDDAYITGAIERVCALDADILAITGDFMTCIGDEQIEKTARILQHLRPARLATLAVLGNHDYGQSARQVWVADRLTRQLERLGIRVLRNQTCDVLGLQVAGLDDVWTPRCDIPMLNSLDPRRASLVLCHNPDAVDSPAWPKRHRGWVLCGHTHGGQCRLPFCEPLVASVNNARYTQGIIPVAPGRNLYINPGLGYLRRIRFNVPPEITVFTLTREECSEMSN